MATRYYFGNATAPFVPTTVRGAWAKTAGSITGHLGFAPEGAFTTVGVAESVGTTNYNVLLGRWVSDPVVAPGDLSGNVTWVIGVKESAAGANDFTQIHIFVTVGDTDTVRGTLLTDFTGATEFTTTATGKTDNQQTIATVTVAAGDRVVVEVGYQSSGSSGISRTGTINYGGSTGLTDLVNGATTVTTGYGWLMFSDPNAVLRALSIGQKNMCPNPSMGTSAGSNITSWRGDNITIARVTGRTGFSRTTAALGTVTATAYMDIILPLIAAAVGETWSGYVEVAASRSISGTVYFNYTDASAAFLNNNSQPITFGTTPQIVAFSNLTAPGNTAFMYISVESANALASDTLTVTCARYDLASAIADYEDGGSSGWTWDGTTDLSTSHALPAAALVWRPVHGPNYRR